MSRKSEQPQPAGESADVPGADAPTVKVSALVNSLPRWLLKSSCSLSGFLRSFFDTPKYIGYPYFQFTLSHLAYAAPLSRSFSGSSKPLWQKRAVCLQVLVLDWLVLDCPRTVPQELRCVVGRLEFLSWDRSTPSDIDPELMGRAASKIEAFDRELGAIHRVGAFLTDRVSAYFSVRPAKFKDR